MNQRCPFKGQESCSGTNPCCMEPDEESSEPTGLEFAAAIGITLVSLIGAGLLAWLI